MFLLGRACLASKSVHIACVTAQLICAIAAILQHYNNIRTLTLSFVQPKHTLQFGRVKFLTLNDKTGYGLELDYSCTLEKNN